MVRTNHTGELIDTVGRPVIHKQVYDGWRVKQRMMDNYTHRPYFFTNPDDVLPLLDPESKEDRYEYEELSQWAAVLEEGRARARDEGLEDEEAIEAYARAWWRKRILRPRNNDHPQVKVLARLTQEYDRLSFEGDEEAALKMLDKITRLMKTIDELFAASQAEKLRAIIEGERMHLTRQIKGYVKEDDAKDVEATIGQSPEEAMAEMRRGGFSEDVIKETMGSFYEPPEGSAPDNG